MNPPRYRAINSPKDGGFILCFEDGDELIDAALGFFRTEAEAFAFAEELENEDELAQREAEGGPS